MKIDEFLENKHAFIEQAIDVGNKVSTGDANLTLDLSSIEKMDPIVDYLHNLWKKDLINDTVAWNSSVAFGVLLGDIIIKEHGFHWAMNEEEIPVVETDDGNQLSPITKLYKIITDEYDDGGEGSPSSFYSGFKALQQYYAMSDEEKEKITTYISSEENT